MSAELFTHLLHLSNELGTFEHADHRAARVEHGFCTDDMARVLIAVCREPAPSDKICLLGRTAFRFLADGQSTTGRMRNRRDATGRWTDRPGVDDCWGRSLWAFGTAARRAPEEWMRQAARARFDAGAQQRSRWSRAMAFAALGAAEVLALDPHDGRARLLLADAATTIGAPRASVAWPWPEERLRYANAVIADATIAAGDHLDRPDLLARGLGMLAWLLERETVDGHLSPTPVAGAGPDDDHGRRYDQQPIEVATLADACLRAATVDDDPRWQHAIVMAAAWFAGDNDRAARMSDPDAGCGFDGLTPTGANLNSGAESTLAMISTLQVAAQVALAAR